MISVKFLLEAKAAAFTSATWSLGNAELLKQCLVQRCYPESADRMGPTGRFNYMTASASQHSSSLLMKNGPIRRGNIKTPLNTWLGLTKCAAVPIYRRMLGVWECNFEPKVCFQKLKLYCLQEKHNTSHCCSSFMPWYSSMNFCLWAGTGHYLFHILWIPLKPDTLMETQQAWTSQGFQMLGHLDALGERCLSRTFWTFNETHSFVPLPKIWWFQKY